MVDHGKFNNFKNNNSLNENNYSVWSMWKLTVSKLLLTTTTMTLDNYLPIKIRERVRGKKQKNQSQTELVSESHLGKRPFGRRCLPTTARSTTRTRRGGRKTLGTRECANEGQTRELRILSGDWFCFFSLCVK
jgi:hypothetical protein